MPSLREHLEKSKHNETLADLLATKNDYFDWAVTVLFYAALHYVDAVLSVSRLDPLNHAQRHSAMGANDTLRRIFPEYRNLETMSRNARYFALPIRAADWKSMKEDYEILRAHFLGRLGSSSTR